MTPTKPFLDHTAQGIKLLINGGSCKDSCKRQDGSYYNLKFLSAVLTLQASKNLLSIIACKIIGGLFYKEESPSKFQH